MSYLTVAGRRIAYDREGSGPPLMLVHGAAQDSAVWRDVTPYLTSNFDVISPDLPGHGKSDLWHGGVVHSVDVHAEVLMQFIRSLGLERPVVVGHSLGAAVCLRLASRWVTSVSAVVNIAGSAESATARVGYPGDLLDLAEVNPTDWMETNFYSLFGRHIPASRRWELSFDARRVAPEVVIGDLHAYTSCDFLSELTKIEAPVLSVAGEDDWSCTPERVRLSHEMLSAKSKYVLLDSVGHLPQLEAPSSVAELIRQFIGERT